jgi:hypothetical protein
MYRDRLTWASNEPSSIVVETINGRGVNELAADNDDLHILCDSLYEFEIVVSELPELRRRRGRPPRPDPFAAGLDAEEGHYEDLLLQPVNAHGFRSVRQFWNPVPCEFCGAIDLLYFKRPAESRC